MVELKDDVVRIKISSKCARQKWNGCQEEYIREVCNGRCCTTGDGELYIPILEGERERIEELGGEVEDGFLVPDDGCPFQEEIGFCSIHNERPFTCRLSPWTLNGNGTLITKNRSKLLNCYDVEPKLPTYKAYKHGLIAMFGEEEANRIVKKLDNGADDFIAYMPRKKYKMIMEQLNRHREEAQSMRGGD